MIPVLYDKNEKQFRTYGLGELADYSTAPEVKRVRNGEYEFYMTYEREGVLADRLEEGMLIKSDAGRRTKWQTFEIVRVRRESGKQIEVWANHISHRTAKDVIRANVGVSNATAEEALRVWNNSLVGDEKWTVQSDITSTGTTRWPIESFQTARDVLGGVRGSILDVWGGEYEFDNRNIRLHREMGRKAATLLEYGRNITSLEQDRDQSNVYTSVYPFARYTPEGSSDMRTVTMGGKHYVDGKYIDMYSHRKIQLVDFSEEFREDDEPTSERLKQLAERYAESNEVGAPHENIKVSYIDLSQTLDYQDYQVMEEVELNDRVPIVYRPFGITNLNAKVVSITYQPTLNQNKEIELGVIGQRLGSTLTSGISGRLEQVEREQARQRTPFNTNDMGNKVWSETPDENMEHAIGDIWFEENGPYTRLRVWNGNQWIVKIDTEDVDKVAKEIEEQQAKLEAFEQSIKELQDRNDEELAEFEKQLEELRQSGVSEEQIDEAIKRAGFDSVEIENLKRQLGETSDTAELAVEMIGNDGKTRYSRNRVDGATDGQVEFGGQPLEVTHNGDGFVAGQTYTISFDALCEMLEQIGVDIRFNYPTDVTRSVTVTFKPDESLFDTVEQTVESRFRSDIFKGYRYTMTIESDWYKSTERSVESESDIVEVVGLTFKDVLAGSLSSNRILNWSTNPDIVFKGVI